MILDYRSDTLTRPTQAMKTAMFSAEVGDDVFAEDPTINELQNYAARLFGMEAALFCSSGTQTNQIAINVHTRPGEEVICSQVAHVYLYEGGGIAQNSGCSVRLIEGDRGRFTAADVEANINNRPDAHLPWTSLVCIEDTVNKGGGAIWDIEEIKKIRAVCKKHGLALHCDGARLFNALVETGVAPDEYAKYFDSISICLSKGLGAPVGSLLLGSADFIKKAHRRRKSLGGGMRQAGFIAAAGLYALQHHVERLKIDHGHARQLAEALIASRIATSVMPVETNIVIYTFNGKRSMEEEMTMWKELGVLCFPFGKDKIRFVVHLDLSEEMIQKTIAIIQQLGA